VTATDARQELFDVDAGTRLDIDVKSGMVRIDEGRAGGIAVTVEPAEAYDIERTAGSVRIRQRSSWGFRGRTALVTATVPTGTDLEVSAASGDMRALARLGNVRLRTASGDIELRAGQRVEVTTAAGDVRIDEAGGDVTVNSASGDVICGSVGGGLAVTSASGDVRAEWVRGDLRVNTASGDVNVSRCDGRDIAVKTLSGDIVLGLPPGIRADADISTISGRVHLPEGGASPVAGDRREVRLALRSVSGDVRVVRAAPA
jgi:DUF4097 and DUF4098 domain-containing protein YvlB